MSKSADYPELTVEDVLSDPSASNWLKDSLRSALRRDPVDAVSDAHILSYLLKNRTDSLLG